MIRILLLIILLVPSSALCEDGWLEAKLSSDASRVRGDYSRFYSNPDNYLKLGAALAGAGLFANTYLDREANEYYRDDLRSDATDTLSDVARVPGHVWVTVPLLFGAHLVADEGAHGTWIDLSLRSLVLGGPLGLVIQSATGGARPSEGGSRWKPFKDNNGLSGHAFVGAVPFMAAAKMESEPYIKAFLYGVSALPALSRMNDEKHYLSQAALGWYLAYLTTAAVSEGGSTGPMSFEFAPPARGDGLIVTLRAVF